VSSHLQRQTHHNSIRNTEGQGGMERCISIAESKNPANLDYDIQESYRSKLKEK
jgi:hypothetical protein